MWNGSGTYLLDANVENAVAGGDEGVEITGNALDNDISGTGGLFVANILDGGDGDDILRGGGGDDTLRAALATICCSARTSATISCRSTSSTAARATTR